MAARGPNCDQGGEGRGANVSEIPSPLSPAQTGGVRGGGGAAHAVGGGWSRDNVSSVSRLAPRLATTARRSDPLPTRGRGFGGVVPYFSFLRRSSSAGLGSLS